MQSRARPSAGQHRGTRRHPIHGMAGRPSTSPRKAKVRAIDSKLPRAARLGMGEFLAKHIPARRARMITAIAIIIFIAWFLVFIFQTAPRYKITDRENVDICTV